MNFRHRHPTSLFCIKKRGKTSKLLQLINSWICVNFVPFRFKGFVRLLKITRSKAFRDATFERPRVHDKSFSPFTHYIFEIIIFWCCRVRNDKGIKGPIKAPQKLKSGTLEHAGNMLTGGGDKKELDNGDLAVLLECDNCKS